MNMIYYNNNLLCFSDETKSVTLFSNKDGLFCFKLSLKWQLFDGIESTLLIK